jgi:NAD(P)-dependent dehydrogenase (short-subunit alcohol dehydrogenase family)
MTERNLSMSTETKEIVVVIGPGGIGQAIARRVGAGRTLLLAAHSKEATETAAERLRGDGYEVAVQPTDISDRDAVEALAGRAAEMGPVTQVIHAAGGGWPWNSPSTGGTRSTPPLTAPRCPGQSTAT